MKHLNLWRKYLPRAQYVNLYGPTEITCNCTYYRIMREFGPEEKIPAGPAFSERKSVSAQYRTDGEVPDAEVLTEEAGFEGAETEITKPGDIGEICVAGTALALGYYRNPEQTAKVFVQNPLNRDYPERIYRTGDLGFYDSDGNLCFAGRRDFQIKHMGHRIELEEIELILNGYEEISRAVCLFLEEKGQAVGLLFRRHRRQDDSLQNAEDDADAHDSSGIPSVSAASDDGQRKDRPQRIESAVPEIKAEKMMKIRNRIADKSAGQQAE